MILSTNHPASFYYTLIRESPGIITFLHSDFTIQFHSASFYACTDYQPEETLGENFLQVLHPLDVQPLVTALMGVKSDARSKSRLPLRLRKGSGGYVTVETTVTCVTSYNIVEGYILYSQQNSFLDPDHAFRTQPGEAKSELNFTAKNKSGNINLSPSAGGPTGPTLYAAAEEGITGSMEARPQLDAYHLELQLYRDALDKSVLVATADTTGNIIQVNDLLCNRARYSREELLGKELRILLNSGSHSESFLNYVRETISQGREWRGELCNRTKDGNVYWVEALIQPQMTQGKVSRYLFFGYELTGRKLIEEKIRRSEVRLREAQAVARIGNWEYDPGNRQLVWSDEVFSIYGIDPSGGVPSFDELAKFHHPEDWLVLQEASDLAGVHHEVQTIDVRIIRPDNTVRYINIIGKPVVADNGGVTKLYGTVMDINDRKLAEKSLQQHNDELQRINRQLDRFVYSATHDLRAPLMSMKGLVNLAQIDTEPDQQEKYYQMMLRSIEKLDNIIRDIVDISRNRRTDVQTEKIDFAQIIREIGEGLSHLPGAESIAVRVDVKGDTPFCSDAKRLVIMFNNLLSNAFRYSDSEKADPFVEVDVDITDREAVIRISDNGIGIGSEHLPRIFDMFYRATDSRDGTGLGLYLVKEIVDILGGTVQLQSQLKAGTIFTITLPNRKF